MATAGSITPDVDFFGHRLQDLADPEITLEWLSISSDTTAHGGVIVAAWLADQAIPARFVESILQMPENQLVDVLPQLIFLHIENTYFSERWWCALPEESRQHLTSLAVNPHPYYQKTPFLRQRLVPWTSVSVRYLG